MTVPVLLFSLVGLGFFYLQNLVFFPYVHLQLLALLIFCLALRPSLTLALSLGLVLGLVQDCYATTPFGLHLGAALVLVGCARFFRRRFLFQSIGSQVLGGLCALVLQEGFSQVGILLLGYQGYFVADLMSHRSMEIPGTAALAPLMYHLILGLEKVLGRFGWWPQREPAPFQSLS